MDPFPDLHPIIAGLKLNGGRIQLVNGPAPVRAQVIKLDDVALTVLAVQRSQSTLNGTTWPTLVYVGAWEPWMSEPGGWPPNFGQDPRAATEVARDEAARLSSVASLGALTG